MPAERPPRESRAVGRFYDDNTSWFLRFGQATDGAIHRAVWMPGVADRRAAMAAVDVLVLDRATGAAAAGGRRPRGADLGCGVGTSLCRMAAQVPLEGVGVTISPAQVDLARQRIEAAGLGSSVR